MGRLTARDVAILQDMRRRIQALAPVQAGGPGRQPTPGHVRVRVIDERQSHGHYLGVLTLLNSSTGLFEDQLDNPCWVRTPNYHNLTVGVAGDSSGVGVVWGTVENVANLHDESATGTGTNMLALPLAMAPDSGAPGGGTIGTGTGTDDEDDPCFSENSFYVYYYLCEEGAPGTGTGTGTTPGDTGTNSGTGSTTVACCANTISTTLELTLSMPPGSCTLTWDPVNQWWAGTGKYSSGLCSPEQQDFQARLRCGNITPGLWSLKMCFNAGSPCDMNGGFTCTFAEGSSLTEVSCNPLELSFGSGPTCTTCYSGGASVNGTINESSGPP